MIPTKKQFCETYIKKYAMRHNTNPDIIKSNYIHFSYRSTSLGIALETIGAIDDPEVLDYLSTRGGIIDIYPEEERNNNIFTMRELLSLFPD